MQVCMQVCMHAQYNVFQYQVCMYACRYAHMHDTMFFNIKAEMKGPVCQCGGGVRLGHPDIILMVLGYLGF